MFGTSAARLGLCAAALLVAATGRARAQDDPEPRPEWGEPAEPATAPAQIERPKLLSDAQPRYPEKAWNDQREADVVVLLTVDEEGVVTEAEVAEAAGHGFDEEALAAARKLRFSPARIDGVASAVQIRYTFRFRITEKASVAAPPAATAARADDRKPSKIVVTVYERGKGKRLAGIEVYLLDEDRVVLTDGNGRFEISGPPGAYAFTIRPPGFYPYHATERVEEGQTVELEYFVRRHRRSRYSTIVWGSEDRAELARTSLVDDEIRSVAGTLGDPIRVAMLLPGVTSSVSGASYPIVRGALPGDSLYEVDGIRIPMLYHLLVGPAVIHPRFVDQIEFQPGGYSAELGRFPGGRIGATTARIGDDPLWVADLSIVETSLLRSQKIGKSSEGVAAARYGTLGYIVEGISSNLIFSYWDYQTRVAHRLPNGGRLSLTVLGASDTAGEKDVDTGEKNVLSVGFHTADLRYRQAIGQAWLQAGVQVGHEFFEPPEEEDDDDMPDAANMETFRPYVEVGYEPSWGRISAGGDLLYQDFGLMLTDDDTFDYSADSGLTLGIWAAARVELGERFQLEPSVRADHYRYDAGVLSPRETSVDPRLAASFDLTDDVVLKVGTGVYSGPTRFSFVEPPIVFGPIPGWEGPGISRGLSRTRQYHAGVEAKLPAGFGLMVNGYYHDQEMPVDFSLLDQETEPDLVPCDGLSPTGTEQPFDVRGSSVGAELLLRRRLGQSLFGWLSYGLSRSNRTLATGKTIPFEFDQRHVLNAVMSWEVGRNWTVGGVFHFNTGRPYTPTFADQCGLTYYEERTGAPNSARLPSHWRVDLRVQKREVFDTWFFDFYIDFFNAAFQWETIDYDTDLITGERVPEQLPLFIPMIGIRGEL